jgi:hypothetical protein
MEQQVRAALDAEAERVDVNVDRLWRCVEPAVAAQPAGRRGWAVAGAVAAALLLVLGAAVLSSRGDRASAPVPAAPATGASSTPDDSGERPSPGPISLTARRIDGNVVRGEILVVDVRTKLPPVKGLVGPLYTYAYPCRDDGIERVCVTRVDSGTPSAMYTAQLSRSFRPGLPVVPWSSGRQFCCGNLIALPAGRGDSAVTGVWANEVRLPVQRFRGESWPYQIVVAVSPGEIFGPRSGSIEIELQGGRMLVVVA